MTADKMRLRSLSEPLRLGAMVVGMHLAALSLVLGPGCVAYLFAAYLSAVLVWGGVRLAGLPARAGLAAGTVLSLAVQQAAYHNWEAELGGFWVAMGQFLAMQLLIGVAVGYAIDCVFSSAKPVIRRG